MTNFTADLKITPGIEDIPVKYILISPSHTILFNYDTAFSFLLSCYPDVKILVPQMIKEWGYLAPVWPEFMGTSNNLIMLSPIPR